MLKGTITDSYGRVSKIELKDTSKGLVGALIGLGLAVLGGAATYGGQVAASWIQEKILEKKSKKNNNKK